MYVREVKIFAVDTLTMGCQCNMGVPGRGSSSCHGLRAEKVNLSVEERCVGTAQERTAVRRGSAGRGMESSMEEEDYQKEKANLVCQVRLDGEG